MPKSPMMLKKSTNTWKTAKTSLIPSNDNSKPKAKRSSKKQISSSKIAENDSKGFESFVQEKLKQQGFALSKKEEKLVQEAISKALVVE